MPKLFFSFYFLNLLLWTKTMNILFLCGVGVRWCVLQMLSDVTEPNVSTCCICCLLLPAGFVLVLLLKPGGIYVQNMPFFNVVAILDLFRSDYTSTTLHLYLYDFQISAVWKDIWLFVFFSLDSSNLSVTNVVRSYFMKVCVTPPLFFFLFFLASCFVWNVIFMWALFFS